MGILIILLRPEYHLRRDQSIGVWVLDTVRDSKCRLESETKLSGHLGPANAAVDRDRGEGPAQAPPTRGRPAITPLHQAVGPCSRGICRERGEGREVYKYLVFGSFLLYGYVLVPACIYII